MSIEIVSVMLIVGLLILMAAGIEIAVAMGLISSIGLMFVLGKSQIQIAWSSWVLLNSFTLLPVPLFIFMGAMFANSGVVRSLFEVCNKWFGGLPGGLATTVMGASAVFGAISGSTTATAATFGLLTFPEMEKRGYSPKLAFGSIAVGGVLSVLIPPSFLLIVYGAWEEQPISQLFAAGVLPGIIVTILLIVTIMIMATVNKKLAPKGESSSWRERIIGLKDVLPWLLIIILVLGSIFGGIMTPTEASALGAFLSIVTVAAFGKLKWKHIETSFLTAAKVTAMIGFVTITAKLLAFVFQGAGLTEWFKTIVLALPLGKYGIMAALVVMYLALGMFFDSVSMMLLTLPFVMPIINGLGFHPIWWGVTYVVLAEIGFVTPPFGLVLFTLKGLFPKYSIATISLGVLPLLIPMLVIIIMLIAFPQLAMWLPRLLYS